MTTFALTYSAFTDLGPGPVTVTETAGVDTYVIVANSQPPATAIGAVLNANKLTPSITLPRQNHVWARSADPAHASSVTTSTPAGASSLANGQVAIGTTATLILPAQPGRKHATIINDGTTDVRLGGANVTAVTGALLVGTAGTGIDIEGDAAIYGVVASGAGAVSFVETF